MPGQQQGRPREQEPIRTTHTVAAAELQASLQARGIVVDQAQLASEIANLGQTILFRESRRGIFAEPMDRFAEGVIAMADAHELPIRSAIGRTLIGLGLGYEADQIAMRAAKGENALEHPIIATALATAELIPEVGEWIVPLIGAPADVAVGLAIAGMQWESYAPVPDITDPSGKREVRHRGARIIPPLTGPEPTIFFNTTLTLAFMRSFSRALIRQLQFRPEYQDQIEAAMTRAAAIEVGTEIVKAQSRRRS